MKKTLLLSVGLLFTNLGCQTESLDIQRTFPFQLEMDAFPTSIPLFKGTSVGFSIKPDYLTSGNAYMFSWRVAAPQRGTLIINKQIVEPGGKTIVLANMSRLLNDTLTYVPTDSGAHELTFRVFDTMGQSKDTTFTVTAIR